MDNGQKNPKLIFRNALFLFLRLGVSLFIAFYTTRLTLQVLGDIDYGINSIVGGIIAMFAVVSLPVVNSLQRFFNVEFSKESTEPNIVFNTALRLIVLLTVTIFLMYETIGLFFIYHVIDYPAVRASAVITIFHIGALASAISFLIIPFTALLFSKENMGIPATVGVVDSVLKLLLLITIPYVQLDSLVLFSLIQLLLFIGELVFYWSYCKRSYPYISIIKKYDVALGKRMLSFSGWNMIESAATISITYVSNVFVNIFGGVLYNAAYGLAKQLNSALMAFTLNVLKAVEPQITTATVAKDDQYRNRLLLSTIKITMIGMGYIFLVFHFFGPYLLKMWLKHVPSYSLWFCEMFLLSSILTSVFLPIRSLILAIGKVRDFFIAYGMVSFSLLFLMFVFLKYGVPVEWIMIMQCINAMIILVLSVFTVCKESTMSVQSIFTVFIRCLLVLIVTAIPFKLVTGFNEADGLLPLLSGCVLSVLILLITVHMIVLDKVEKSVIHKFVSRKIYGNRF